MPKLHHVDVKRKRIEKINAALADAYQGVVNPRKIMIFINEYLLENVGWQGRLQSDKPETVEIVKK